MKNKFKVKRGNRKTQISSEVFVYILTTVIVGVILVMGYRYVSSTKESVSKTDLISLKNKLTSDIKTISQDYGRFKKFSYSLSAPIELCLLNLERKNEILQSELINFYPLIKDSLQSGSSKNTFLVGNQIFDSYFAGNIEINHYPYFKCLKPQAGEISFGIEGLGNKALILTEFKASASLDANRRIELESTDDIINLVIKEGTTAQANGNSVDKISVEIVEPTTVNTQVNTQESKGSDIYKFEPSGAVFNPPIELRIEYNPADIVGCPSSLNFYQYKDDGTLKETIPSKEIDCKNHIAVFEINSFSFGYIGVPLQKPFCGNGIVEEGEACDGNNFLGLKSYSCEEYSSNFASGKLRCTSSCKIDTTGCVQKSNCTDSDNGYNIYIKGIVYGEPSSIYGDDYADDWCTQSGLREYYLGQNCEILYKDVNCSCSYGACLRCPLPPPCPVQLIVGDPKPDDPNRCPGYICPIFDCKSYGANYWCGNLTLWDLECEGRGTIKKLDTPCDLEGNYYCITCQEENQTCGNGVLDIGELCDGRLFGAINDCTDYKEFSGGVLKCTNCKLDISGCILRQQTVCGNRVCETGENESNCEQDCAPCTLETGQLCNPNTKQLIYYKDGCERSDLILKGYIKDLTLCQVCGNKIAEANEECDDGNLVNGDGCSNCKKEPYVLECTKVAETGCSWSYDDECAQWSRGERKGSCRVLGVPFLNIGDGYVCYEDVKTECSISAICPAGYSVVSKKSCISPSCANTDTNCGTYPNCVDCTKSGQKCQNGNCVNQEHNCYVKVNGVVVKSIYAIDRNDCYIKTSFGSKNCEVYNSFFKEGENLLEQYFGTTDRVNSDKCVKTTCTDSDNGKNYYLRGETRSVSDLNGDVRIMDSCFSENTLWERYCDYLGNIQLVSYTCPNGCKEGACVNQTCATKGTICGGPTQTSCCSGLTCKFDEIPPTWVSIPERSGKCINLSEVICGNNIIEGTEQCDGTNFGGKLCSSLGYALGILRCTSTCQLDTSGCTPKTCGNKVCDQGETQVNCPGDCQLLKENVKCVFEGTNYEQNCYPDSAESTKCSGIGSCIATAIGKKGEIVTWKSSCGGYQYTTIDGQEENAYFKCAAVCGNGIIEGNEQCDGKNFSGKTCQTYGFSGGNLTCNSNCTTISTQNCIKSYCKETDNGYDIYVRGITYSDAGYSSLYTFYLPYRGLSDYCSDNYTLIEYGCNEDKTSFGERKYTCEFGCYAGACLKSDSCIDSDNKYEPYQDIFIKGTVIYNGKYYTDYCTTLTSLMEQQCINFDGTIQWSEGERNCPNGCKDGKCIRAICGDGIVQIEEECDDGNIRNGDGCGSSCKKENCTDTDGGENYYLKGETRAVDSKGTPWYRRDICIDITQPGRINVGECKDENCRVDEFYCSRVLDSPIAEHLYKCPDNCQDGACLRCPSPPPCPVPLIYGDPIPGSTNQCPRYVCPSNVTINCQSFGQDFWCSDLNSWNIECRGRGTIKKLDKPCDNKGNYYCATCREENQTCGNGIVDVGEQCDGKNFGSLNNNLCFYYSKDFTSGTLKCTNCKIDTSDCLKKTCTDTDDGVNTFEGGKTYLVGGNVYYDDCSTNYSVVEYYCSYDPSTNTEFVKKDEIKCSYGCKEGACLTQTICDNGVAEGTEQCDDGNTINGDGCGIGCIKETLTCTNECSQEQKRCLSNSYQVCGNYDNDNCLEWSSTFTCSDGFVCAGGSCIQQKCTDSDGGKNYNIKGTISGPSISPDTATDDCVIIGSKLMLVERYCSGNLGATIDYECPNGCRNGVCIQCKTISKTGCTNIQNCQGESFTASQCTKRTITTTQPCSWFNPCSWWGATSWWGITQNVVTIVYDCTKQVCS